MGLIHNSKLVHANTACQRKSNWLLKELISAAVKNE